MQRATATILATVSLLALSACSKPAEDPSASPADTTPTTSNATTSMPPAPPPDPPAVGDARTHLGPWVIFGFFGARGLGPASVVDIAPDGYMYIEDEINGNVLTVRYRIMEDGRLAATGPEGLFREKGQREGHWTVEMTEDQMFLRQEDKEIAMTRDHIKVRDRNVGYAFTEADQRLRAEIQRRMRNYGIAVVRHASQNDGRLPASFTTVWAAGLVGDGNPELLISPMGPVGDGLDDYWLAPPTRPLPEGATRARLGDSPDPAREVLLYDRASYKDGKGVHVVFFDGHVEIMSRESFRGMTTHRANAGVEFNIPNLN